MIQGGCSGVVGHVDIGPAVVVQICHGHRQTVGTDGVPHPTFFGDIGEGPIPVVVIEDVLSALKPRRAAGYLNAFIGAASGFGKGSGLDIEVDVISDEEIKIAVPVVI